MIQQDKTIKDKRLGIRVDEDTLNKFSEACKNIGTTPSDEIRRHVVRFIKDNLKE